MNKILRLFYTGLFLLIACFALEAAAAGIKWRNYSENVFAQAKAQNRPVLLVGKSSWCPWCQQFLGTTLQNPIVIQRVNAGFIPVLIDVDQSPSLVRQYHMSSLPAIIILNANQDTIVKSNGYLSAPEFLDLLKQ